MLFKLSFKPGKGQNQSFFSINRKRLTFLSLVKMVFDLTSKMGKHFELGAAIFTSAFKTLDSLDSQLYSGKDTP